jgi:hypothetical protein
MVLSGEDYVGLEQHPLEIDLVLCELAEEPTEHPLGCLETPLDPVVALHQDLGLDDRDEPRLLRQSGEPGKGMGVGLYAERRG